MGNVNVSGAKSLVGHYSGVLCIRFSPDDHTLASGGRDRSIRLWDAATGACLRTLDGHSLDVTCLCFSPEGTRLASGSEDATARLWDVATGVCVAKLCGRFVYVNAGAEGFKAVGELSAHVGAIRSIAFAPNGRLLATGGDDHSVRLWDASSGFVVRVLVGSPAPVPHVLWSPDGRAVIAGTSAAVATAWEAVTGHVLLAGVHLGGVPLVTIAASPLRTWLSVGKGRVVLVAPSAHAQPLLLRVWAEDKVCAVWESVADAHLAALSPAPPPYEDCRASVDAEAKAGAVVCDGASVIKSAGEKERFLFESGSSVEGPEGAAYEVVELLGSGSFASVYLARTEGGGGQCALKHMRAELRSVWEAESSLHGRLQHRCVVRLLCAWTSDAGAFMALEHCASGSLHGLICRVRARMDEGGPNAFLAPVGNTDQFSMILCDVVSALDYCERNRVVHADIKPDNVLLTADFRYKLADFGVAHTIPDGAAGVTCGACGSVPYMAPEVFAAYEAGVPLLLDPRVDAYSMGLALLETVRAMPRALLGRLGDIRAFHESKCDVVVVDSDHPSAPVRRVLRRALRHDRERRSAPSALLRVLEDGGAFQSSTTDAVRALCLAVRFPEANLRHASGFRGADA